MKRIIAQIQPALLLAILAACSNRCILQTQSATAIPPTSEFPAKHIPGPAGKWRWFNPTGSLVDIYADGTADKFVNGNLWDTGTWAPLNDAGLMRINWKSGWTDQWQISADGRSMSGTNQDGQLPTVFRS